MLILYLIFLDNVYASKKQINHSTNSTKKKQKDKKRGLYHGLPKELQITVLMMCMEDAPATRKLNNDDINRSREWRAKKDNVAEEKGLVDTEDEFIECIIYHRMWDSEACWKTVTDVTRGLRRIKTKSGKIASLSWLAKGATDYSFDDVHGGCTGNQKAKTMMI